MNAKSCICTLYLFTPCSMYSFLPFSSIVYIFCFCVWLKSFVLVFLPLNLCIFSHLISQGIRACMFSVVVSSLANTPYWNHIQWKSSFSTACMHVCEVASILALYAHNNYCTNWSSVCFDPPHILSNPVS